MKRLRTISMIEEKLKKSGTNPSILLYVPKNSYFERLKVPKKVKVRNLCCRFKLSFFFCFFLIVLIDFFLTIKHLIILKDLWEYTADFPWLVTLQNCVKGTIQFCIISVEYFFVFRDKQFTWCKISYALKFVQILFVLVQAFCFKDLLQEQCNTWLSNPIHGFKRDSSDINRSRPMTQVFYCNLERILENKEKQVDENTVMYFQQD